MSLNPFYSVNRKGVLHIYRSKEWEPGYCPKESLMYTLEMPSYSLSVIIFGEISLENINTKGLCVTDPEKKSLAILSVDIEKFENVKNNIYRDSGFSDAEIPCSIIGNFDLDRILNELVQCVEKG